MVTEEFDAGPIVAQAPAVPPPERGKELRLHALVSAGEALVQAVPALLAGQSKPVPQDLSAPQRHSYALSEMVIRPSHCVADILRIFQAVGPLREQSKGCHR